jgi:N-acetylglucosaminyldiphosphoundecaprenol N-acetyl-beta-D-mannosaminyltransferase
MTAKIDILGVKIDETNLRLASQSIHDWIKNRQKTYVCVAPVSTVVDCQKDEQYKDTVNQAGLVTPDGMPLVWLGRLSGSMYIERTYGPDLMLTVCEVGLQYNYRHFFYGATIETLHKLLVNLSTRFPKINIAGHYAPGFRANHELEHEQVLNEINKAKPDILWIGLGSPKQDFWMREHRDKLDVPVMVGVGAAFDFISGVKKQAPKWIRSTGLEWLYRLCQEPRRLWKRYLIGNSLFIYFLVIDFFKKLGQKARF